MNILQLSDTKVGNIKPERRLKRNVVQNFSNPIWEEVDVKAEFISSIDRTNLLKHHNLPVDTQVYHKNYIGYLTKCWADHLGVVFTPDILWYTLLGELTSIVSKNPDIYRSIFTQSQEKENLIVVTEEPEVMPLSLLIEQLASRVPTDIDLFLPQFTTSTSRSRHAMYAAFADMCSPYYNYFMYCCDLPVIDVRGEKHDYEFIYYQWMVLCQLFGNHTQYMNKVAALLNNILTNFENVDFWKKIFRLDRCGSGSQVEVGGWWKDFFFTQPSVAYPENYSPHIAKVSYKQLNTQTEYIMYDGLFYSNMDGDFLVPNFGSVVYEKRA